MLTVTGCTSARRTITFWLSTSSTVTSMRSVSRRSDGAVRSVIMMCGCIATPPTSRVSTLSHPTSGIGFTLTTNSSTSLNAIHRVAAVLAAWRIIAICCGKGSTRMHQCEWGGGPGRRLKSGMMTRVCGLMSVVFLNGRSCSVVKGHTSPAAWYRCSTRSVPSLLPSS